MESPVKIESENTRPSRRFALGLAILIGLLLAKTGFFIAAGQGPLEADAVVYWNGGQRVLEGDWLLLNDPPEVSRTPGYFWFVAFFQATCGIGRSPRRLLSNNSCRSPTPCLSVGCVGA